MAAGVDGLEHVTFMTADGVDPVPPDLLKLFATEPVTLSVTLGFTAGQTIAPAMAARLPALMANLRTMVEAGARIVVGTDAGVGPNKPHDILPVGVAQLTTVGMSPAEALRSATSRAAATLGLTGRKGRLAPGHDADILAVDGDPLLDPKALQRVRAVWLRGALTP
jgi:imidazolonepropionase-like amidohydrolase